LTLSIRDLFFNLLEFLLQPFTLRCNIDLSFVNDMNIETRRMTRPRQFRQRIPDKLDLLDVSQPLHRTPILFNQLTYLRFLDEDLARAFDLGLDVELIVDKLPEQSTSTADSRRKSHTRFLP
jgi:hypothetical protein